MPGCRPGHIHFSQSGLEFIVLASGELPWHRGYPGISAKSNPYAFLSMLKKKGGYLFLDFKKITCYPWQALTFK